ncbi:nucleotidyltransferase domain-containing protein [Candidatus Dojkabacteria bacterium]|jgi:predicted nucleotidyltransferase|nr:nucleotidyltransferase domain-containing protein [Candidatus Dojkabacteria bacterium]
MKEKIIDILSQNGISESKILNIYMYGSRVYGTTSEISDYDFIVIISSSSKGNYFQIIDGDINITIYDLPNFIMRLNNHDIDALECLFLSDEHKIQENIAIKSNIDLAKLRHSFSKMSSNSWVKAKKKFIVKKDYNPYIGKKSLFHSMRILMFGCQIAKHGKITNYSEANYVWERLLLMNDDYMTISKYFKPGYNALGTLFRGVAPKNIEND